MGAADITRDHSGSAIVRQLIEGRYLSLGGGGMDTVSRGSETPTPLCPWRFSSVLGQVVEIEATGRSAQLTAASLLLYDAQREKETSAWITHSGGCFYPPDLSMSGVDLAALAVIRVENDLSMLRAADKLLRSGGFGLVVVDLCALGHTASAHRNSGIMFRLSGVTRKNNGVLALLTSFGRNAASSAVSTRVRAVQNKRRHGDDMRDGRIAVTIECVREKRGNGGWTVHEVCCGPDGMC